MKLVISGYGKMGHIVEAVAKEQGLEIALATEDVASVPDVISTPCGEVLASECVCIDFTTPSAFRQNYAVLASKFKAVVVGTTGWEDIRSDVFEAFRSVGTTLIWASNFSIGVNAYFAAIQRVSEVLKGAGYVPTVEETHHVHKLDSPSGTAKSIAAIIENSLGVKPEISSFRVGEVPGIHTAVFSSKVDKLSFTHEAFSREGFARGAVFAAIMSEKVTGVHEFKDVLL